MVGGLVGAAECSRKGEQKTIKEEWPHLERLH